MLALFVCFGGLRSLSLWALGAFCFLLYHQLVLGYLHAGTKPTLATGVGQVGRGEEKERGRGELLQRSHNSCCCCCCCCWLIILVLFRTAQRSFVASYFYQQPFCCCCCCRCMQPQPAETSVPPCRLRCPPNSLQTLLSAFLFCFTLPAAVLCIYKDTRTFLPASASASASARSLTCFVSISEIIQSERSALWQLRSLPGRTHTHRHTHTPAELI